MPSSWPSNGGLPCHTWLAPARISPERIIGWLLILKTGSVFPNFVGEGPDPEVVVGPDPEGSGKKKPVGSQM